MVSIVKMACLALLTALAETCRSKSPPSEGMRKCKGEECPISFYHSAARPGMSYRGECGHNRPIIRHRSHLHNYGDLRILGGYPAAANEFPFQVFVRIGGGQCGGSIIAPRWVLTAAHCTGTVSSEMCSRLAAVKRCHVVVGANVPLGSSADGEWMEIEHFFIPPIYFAEPDNGANDIALLHLKEAITFDTWRVQPVCLPQSCDDTCHGLPYVLGWGLQKAGGQSGAREKLRVTRVEINPNISPDDCSDGSRTCAGVPGFVGICEGDSGGPLICADNGYFRIDGIASKTVASMCGVGLFTNVCRHLKWIESTLANFSDAVGLRHVKTNHWKGK